MTEPDLTFLDTSSLLICTLRGHSSWSSSSSIVATESSSQDPVSHQCNYFLNAIDKTEEVMEEINKILNQSSKQSADGLVEEKLRRQGLNRLSKRSRISFKQSLSPNQNTIIEKPSTHIAEDPEEYFAAIKRNENAERELKKLKGEDHTRDEVKRTNRQRRPGLTKKRTSLNHFRKGIDLEALKSPNTKECGSPRKDTNLSKNKSQTEEISVCQQYNAVEEASKEKTGGCLEKWFSDMKWLYEREDASAILEAFNVKPIVVDEIRLPITPDTSPDHSPIAKTTVSFSMNLLDAMGRNKVVDPFLSGDNETVDDAGINVTSAHKKRFSPKPPRSPSFRDSNTSITPKKTDSKLISDDKIIPDVHPISPGMKKLSLEKNLPPRSPYSRVSHVNEMVSDINDTPTRLKKSSLTGILKPPRSPSLGVSNNSTSCRKAGGKLLLDSHTTLAEKGDDLPQHIIIQNQLVESPTHHKTFNNNEGQVLQSLDIMDVVDDILSNVGGTDCIKDRLCEVTEVLHEETEKSESVRGQSSAAMDTTVVPARHQGDDLPRHILIQNQPAQSPLHCETTNTAEEVPQSLDSLGAVDDILTNVGDTNSIKDRLGEVLHEETEQSENFRGQLSASIDMTVVPTGHQESSSILAEPHIEIETRVPKKRGRPKVGKEMSKIKSLSGGTASVSGVLLEHWHEETEQSKSVRGRSNASMGTTVVADGHQESSSILAEQHIEIETKVPKKRGRPKLAKENSKIKSLEGIYETQFKVTGKISNPSPHSGETALVSGVRRSTRMKFRPLEHWRGEKLLFGRLDKDLPTLLGVKCFTPHGRTKVKLCVSDEHTKHLPSAAFN